MIWSHFLLFLISSYFLAILCFQWSPSLRNFHREGTFKSIHFENVRIVPSHLMDTLDEFKILDWKIIFPQTIQGIGPWFASILLMRNLMLMWFLFFLADSFFLSVNFYDCVCMLWLVYWNVTTMHWILKVASPPSLLKLPVE